LRHQFRRDLVLHEKCPRLDRLKAYPPGRPPSASALGGDNRKTINRKERKERKKSFYALFAFFAVQKNYTSSALSVTFPICEDL